MAIQSAFYFTDGTTRTFPSTKHIASSTNVAVWMKRVVDDVWELTSHELWTLANNSIVFTVAPQSTVYSQIELRIADESDELTESPSNIALVAGSIANVDTVATNISAVNTVSTNITAVQNTSANATNINTVATNIANVNTVVTNIANVNTVATNITNVNAVCSNIANVNTTATNIADINNVVIQVIPNLSEILLADDNATIATNKALEASGSATIATNKALEASGSATIATNKALEASGSATIATNKALEASGSATTATTKAGEALTSANNAYASEVQAGIYAAQAQESALIVSPENYVQTTGDETIAGIKTFSSSPIVPTPTTGTQVANKDYVDNVAVFDINSLTNKTTPVNNDNLALQEAGGLFKKVSFENLIKLNPNDPRVKTALNATGTAPIYACRAWVNFNGQGTVAIRASGNVSSITDGGTGFYGINFIENMPDVNYSFCFGMRSDSDSTFTMYNAFARLTDTKTVGCIYFRTMYGYNGVVFGYADSAEVSAQIFGN